MLKRNLVASKQRRTAKSSNRSKRTDLAVRVVDQPQAIMTLILTTTFQNEHLIEIFKSEVNVKNVEEIHFVFPVLSGKNLCTKQNQK